jgi:urease accessory protein
MHLSQARGDWSVVAQAVQAWQAQDEACLIDLNDWVLMTRESKEFRLQCLQMGRSLLLWLRAQKTCPLHDLETLAAWSEPTWPLVFALALHWSQADLPAALTALAFGWAENMTQTAMKTIPLGQTSGQNILSKLLQDIPLAVQTALDTPANERQLFTPHLSILSARHEHQYSRLFRS